jgi:inorganic pyrophosphatase
MYLEKIATGKNPPENINVVIEVPMGNSPIKYEFDKDSGAIFVDRIVHTAMFYPANYGFVPNTLGGDGDPLDVLVICQYPFVPGAVIACRPVGVLIMEDESGEDEKIIAVPVSKVFPFYDSVKEYSDLPEILLQQISHFFEHYKDLEKGKWVKVKGFKDCKAAKEIITDGISRAESAKSKAA